MAAAARAPEPCPLQELRVGDEHPKLKTGPQAKVPGTAAPWRRRQSRRLWFWRGRDGSLLRGGALSASTCEGTLPVGAPSLGTRGFLTRGRAGRARRSDTSGGVLREQASPCGPRRAPAWELAWPPCSLRHCTRTCTEPSYEERPGRGLHSSHTEDLGGTADQPASCTEAGRRREETAAGVWCGLCYRRSSAP